MKIFIYILVVFIILFFSSTFKLKIRYLEKKNFSGIINFDVNLGLYLFEVIKIVSINLKNDGIYFCFFKIPYKKFKFYKMNLKEVKNYRLKENLKNLNLKIEKMNLKINIGVEDIGVTVFAVFAISTFLSIFTIKYKNKINVNNYSYAINPIYNTNTFGVKFSIVISESFFYLLKAIILFKKNKKQQIRDNKNFVKKCKFKYV